VTITIHFKRAKERKKLDGRANSRLRVNGRRRYIRPDSNARSAGLKARRYKASFLQGLSCGE
jgi:hypothetical protein